MPIQPIADNVSEEKFPLIRGVWGYRKSIGADKATRKSTKRYARTGGAKMSKTTVAWRWSFGNNSRRHKATP